jgi:putative membrane-bound dehydrogenase-like protein
MGGEIDGTRFRVRRTWQQSEFGDNTLTFNVANLNMKRLIFVLLLLGISTASAQGPPPKPLRALLIAGGCCHDYAKQQEAICKGIQARANVRVDVYWTDNSTTAPMLPLYSRLNWAEEYDIIIHDECAADIKDPAIVNRIVQVHQKLPAVHLHCAMHSFRTGTDAWFKHLGLQSSGHGPQLPIAIKFVDTDHPITETLSDWTTINEELYNNVKVLGAHPLAVGKQNIGGNKPGTTEAIVVWTNETAGARSFSTTIGHNTQTVQDPRYLELVTRGLLWACGKLNPEYLQPYQGENKVTFIDKEKFKAPEPMNVGKAPDNATFVKATASSTQNGHPPFHAIDSSRETRWCANGASYPQWLQFEFEKPHVLHEITIDWESRDAKYQYVIEGSGDGKEWVTLLDKSKNTSGRQLAETLKKQQAVKFVRITGLGSSAGWCSLWDVKLKGEGIGQLWPADPKAPNGAFVPVKADAYVNRGNTVPRIEKLSAEQEAAILKDVKVPDGFDVTVFASPPAVNYPVFVAADVNGTLYVSSDGNGSLGRDPQRGRVIRLRDLDGDGRADETKVFCEIDAPRGLVWDNDRLYLMHPPNLSAFIDHDGDGVADEQKTLVKNLAFDYDKRPADHTTNGLSLGADGWLYIAGGDFGFIDAEGTDGRKLTHRGGGVIRVRPDGTGLEVYSTGTRNILEVAISPTMDMFARDNTNDGGGWDVRLHHFTGSDDHGYPRLYKNFNSEAVQPLADYGGGSGCGAVYIDEPGFGKWNNAPFTADWGTGSLYRHTVSPSGSTFKETSPPESFIKLTRPTDADVDGNSRVYCASWRGATFNWAGPDVGYIVCVRPKDFQPSPLPSFSTATDNELITVMSSQSHRRRLEAQRTLMRRGNPASRELLDRGVASRSELRNFIDHLQTSATEAECVAALGNDDPVVVHTAVRCLAKRGAYDACLKAVDVNSPSQAPLLRALAMMHQPQVIDGLLKILPNADGESRRDILSALCRLYFQEGEWTGDSWGTRPDTRGPYYQPEPWSQTSKIAEALNRTLDSASPEDAAALIETMQRNRIQSSDSLDRMLRLAETNEKLTGSALSQLASSTDIPPRGVKLLLRVADRPDASPTMLSDAIVSLAKLRSKETQSAILTALRTLDSAENADGERKKAREIFINSRGLETQISMYGDLANADSPHQDLWPGIALLSVASRKNASPESREVAKLAIEKAWLVPNRRGRLMRAAAKIENHYLDDKILTALNDEDAAVAAIAKSVIEQMKIKLPSTDNSPKVSTMSLDKAKARVVAMRGDLTLGQQVFVRANCASCHTVRQDELQKGPFLGNIAKTYKRPDLATAVLEPSKTIAQGFVTNVILTVDGKVLTGFVTAELTDRVTIRDKEGKETTVLKDDIDERNTSTTSVMPSGVMNEYTIRELASLLDYLESLSK